MSVKKSIFGSSGERRGFELIEHTWGDEYRILAQFPWSALFDLDDPELGDILPPGVRRGDTSHFFFKTSVDYVLATREGEPLLAIDFDGMGEGFDRDGEYVEVEQTLDRGRKRKFDLKLQLARREEFPYYIVGSEEAIRVHDGDTHLTILDGMVGYTFGKREFLLRIEQMSDELLEQTADLPLDEQHEVVESAFVTEEFSAHYDASPIRRTTSELHKKIEDIYGLSAYRYEKSLQHSYFPELPPGDLQTRWEALQKAERVSCELTIDHPHLGRESAKAWMRNIGYGGMAEMVTEDLAEFLAFRKLVRKMNQPSPVS